jgi:hypothetical protein
MPLNRYRCLPCGFTDLVLVHAADLDVSRPCCPTCHTPMDWVPDGAAHVPSLGWTLDLGHDGQVSINSIQDANRFERESLQRERDGEGAAYVIKALHQDRQNMDRPVLSGREDTRQADLAASRRSTARGVPIRPTAGPLPSDWND